jgi:hypothetical protein
LQIDALSRGTIRWEEGKKASLLENLVGAIETDYYPNMLVFQDEGKLRVKNPPFGYNYKVKIGQERELKGYTTELKSEVEKVNARIIENQIEALPEFAQVIVSNDQAISIAEQLLKDLVLQCETNCFERMLTTDSFKFKQEAKKIISEAKAMLFQLKENKSEFISASLGWAKYIQANLEQIDSLSPNDYCSVKAAIHDFKSKIQQLHSNLFPDLELVIESARAEVAVYPT